jgi:hypothetical protein
VWCGVSACCSDDVDDQYTEKGRQLIRKEGEALAAGMRIGEVLAAGDLELPGVPPRKKPGGLLVAEGSLCCSSGALELLLRAVCFFLPKEIVMCGYASRSLRAMYATAATTRGSG